MTRAPRPVRRPHAVIFDMDGLMLDTERLAPRAWYYAATAVGVDFDLTLIAPMVGRNFRDCAASLSIAMAAFSNRGADAGVACRSTTPSSSAKASPSSRASLSLLDWLEAEGIPKAVATSTRRDRAQAKLAQTALLPRFVALIGGDEVTNGKPAPDIFRRRGSTGRETQPDAWCSRTQAASGAPLGGRMTPIMVPDMHPPSAALLALEPLVLARR
jgi:beta-phosphoglucomutase-like phosphatase (HAD superfamily)